MTDWGLTLCSLKCGKPAECLLDGLPYCLRCADVEIERWAAVSLRPELRFALADVSANDPLGLPN